jgi:hypothetical protein
MSGTTSGTTKSAGLVANPLYTALHQLYTQLQADAATMSNALKAADQQMAGDNTWVGPAARSWASQLDGYSRDCAAQVNAMLADVSQALQGQQAEVSPQLAEENSRMMILMNRGY